VFALGLCLFDHARGKFCVLTAGLLNPKAVLSPVEFAVKKSVLSRSSISVLVQAEFKALVHDRTPLLRRFDPVAGHQPTDELLPWVCTADDELPTLDDIFQVRPRSLAVYYHSMQLLIESGHPFST
jgi:hypothetical protein